MEISDYATAARACAAVVLFYRKLRQCKSFKQKAKLFATGCGGTRFFVLSMEGIMNI